jgi:hypothetical protein
MGEIAFGRQDIEDLTAKLNGMEDALSEREKILLLAMLSLAGEALRARGQDEVTGFGIQSVSGIQVTTLTNTPLPPLGDAFSAAAGTQPHLYASLHNGVHIAKVVIES